MRRKPGRLLPLEIAVLAAGARLQETRGSFYGFALARELADDDSRDLAAHGTLYKALARLKDSGLLAATWENSDAADAEGRPRRRLYSLTAQGAAALDEERRIREAEARLAAAVTRPATGGAS